MTEKKSKGTGRNLKKKKKTILYVRDKNYIFINTNWPVYVVMYYVA